MTKQIHPSTALFIVLAACLSALLLFSGAVSVQGQSVPTPTLTERETLNLAQQTAQDAASLGHNADGVVTNALNAVVTSNLLLSIATGALLIGGILVLLIALIALRAGVITLRETRSDLDKAQISINAMRADLKSNTDQVRARAGQAIQALALMQLGEQQMSRRNIKGALQMYGRAFVLDSNNQATNYFLGELYVRDNQLTQGMTHLQRVLAADPAFAPAEAALGLALRLQGDQAVDPNQRAMLYVQAEQRLLQALQTDPTVLDIYGEPIQAILGSLYERQGRLEQARHHYAEARKLSPQRVYPL